jgi:hypothetical protein
VSPNGNWIAYTSDETGRNEVWAPRRPTPLHGIRRGGVTPLWTKGARELLYREALTV